MFQVKEAKVSMKDELKSLRARFDKMAAESKKQAIRLDIIEKYVQAGQGVGQANKQVTATSSRLTSQVPLPLPKTGDWRSNLYVHILSPPFGIDNRDKEEIDCGGCVVLWELEDSLKELGITAVSTKWISCPTDLELAHPITNNQVMVFLYTEGQSMTCEGMGNRVHARWILAPLHSYATMFDGKGVYNFRNWGEDDLVFHYASSTAVHPELLPKTNILQVMRNPRPGDGYDDSTPRPTFSPPRRGTLVSFRKIKRWHTNVTHIHMELPEPHKFLNGGMTMKAARDFEYFVSYDPYTFQSYASAMLGAISIVYPLPNLSKKTWAEGTYVGEYLKAMNLSNVPGIAYGFTEAEINYANRTKGELRGFLMNVRDWGKKVTVERFARDCHRYGSGGESKLESGLLVRDAYHKWYDNNNMLLDLGKVNITY